MWSCHKCGKPVYFAERKQSLGYDWHPECLRCEECGKRLNPGQHAEHKGVPYCHVPCYSALFGPTLFGHGSQVESHKSFGKIENRHGTPIPRSHLEAKLRIFNQYYDGNSQELKCRERNGKLILEGVLRIYWGVNNLIHLKEDDDQRTHVQVRKRNSYRAAINNGMENLSSFNYYTNAETIPEHTNGSVPNNDKAEFSDKENREENITTQEVLPDNKENTLNTDSPDTAESCEKNSMKKPDNDQASFIAESDTVKADKPSSPTSKLPVTVNALKKPNTEVPPVRIRKMASSRSKTKLKRRCSINGHYYNRETSVFTPPFGSASNVWVTSLVNSPEVINMLLDKFRVENNPQDFALFIVRDNGETRRIQDDEYPLLVRVILGPHEDVAKVFIMDKHKTNEISSEVAQFLNLTDTELKSIVQRYNEEEDREVKKIRRKFRELKHRIRFRMQELHKQKLKESIETS